MKPFASRYLLLAAFSVLLAACQSAPSVDTPVAVTEPDGFAQLEQSITTNELATAEDQLAKLQAAAPTDIRLEPFQRRLAEAYLSRSQIGLQKGDVNAAATALSRARALMPKAPALTSGVNGAIAHARKAELDKAEAELKAAEAKRVAKLIDPSAESTTIELKIGDMAQLRRQLDAIAADTVAFNCVVLLQVPRTDDYPWLATLLTKRVNKINPDFELELRRKIERNEKATVVLKPAQQ
ncbi:PA5502 family lipoprotein [Pseudomonas viridiflava]|uniref:PA5502 family lipoprotein n=1 Tax=Pseudomonas viridiflava TaxID=33069 RepID=UPI000F04DAEE|nr:PA5502 family lipoprotein [Pseudomonas viridiflava]